MVDFWTNHGIFFLLLCQIFPRLTIVFGTAYPIGADQIIAWLLFPRFLAAYLATQFYWDTNPVLVMVAWIMAISSLIASSVSMTNGLNNQNK